LLSEDQAVFTQLSGGSYWAKAGLALILVGGFCTSALALKPQIPDGQQPPAERTEQKPAEQKPEEKPKCVTSQTDFKQTGDKPTFEVALENSCDMRLKCTIDVFVMGAKGMAQGHTTLTLGAAAKGQSTRKVYVLKVKSAGGMANMSHECKKI
jgi:hypothetical protein